LIFEKARAAKVAERRIALAEVVEHHSDAKPTKPLQAGEGRDIIAKEHALGHLQLEPGRIEPAAGQSAQHSLGKTGTC
jgi:hypothetical protein